MVRPAVADGDLDSSGLLRLSGCFRVLEYPVPDVQLRVTGHRLAGRALAVR
jgi:hypothetical protein